LREARELEPSSIQKGRAVRLVPQGGLPSVSLDSAYSVRRGEYTQTYINGRLIDHDESMARFKDVTFTTTCMKQFCCMVAINLLPQAVHVDLDGVEK
jgi:hypothetical protein